MRAVYIRTRIFAITMRTRTETLMPGVFGVFNAFGVRRTRSEPIPARSGAKTKFDMASPWAGSSAVFASPHLCCQPTRCGMSASGCDGRRRDQAQAWMRPRPSRCNTKVRAGHCIPEDALQPAPTIWDPGAGQHDSRDIRRSRRDRPGFRACRACREEKFTSAPRTGVPPGAALALGQYDAATDSYLLYADSGGAVRHREKRAGPGARCAAGRLRHFPRRWWHSARATAPLSSSAWCCGRQAQPSRSNMPRPGPGSLSQRLPGPRSGDRCRARARRPNTLIGMRATSISNVGARCACPCRR